MSQELVVIEVTREAPRVDESSGLFGLIGRVASFGVRSTGDALEAVIGSDAVEESIDRLLSSPAIERLIQTALSGPLVDALSRELVRQRVVERITTTLIEAGVFEPIVDAFLERPELWVLVEEIAQSPAVSDAIRQQSFGFADQVGDVVEQFVEFEIDMFDAELAGFDFRKVENIVQNPEQRLGGVAHHAQHAALVGG